MLSDTFGESLYDYPHLEISAHSLDYNESQRTFIGGECDFSFTASLIRKRNSGTNCCSTSLYTKHEWNNMIEAIGIDEETTTFKQNLSFCRENQCKVTFGIDGTNITTTQHRWSGHGKKLNSNLKFDRIIYTLPRKYQWGDDEQHAHEPNPQNERIQTVQYNQENQTLYFDLLRAAKSFLNPNGEIHFMMFPHHFWAFNLKYSLSKLDLKITALADLSKNNCLTKIFESYQPRDTNGYYIKLYKHYKPYNMYKIYMCCFKIKKNTHIQAKSLVSGTFRYPNHNYNKYLSIYGLRKNCTLRQLHNLFKPFGVISEAQICGRGIGMVRFQQQFEAQVAIASMNGRQLDGCSSKLCVFYYEAKTKKTRHTKHVTVVMGGFSRETNINDVSDALDENGIVMIESTGITFTKYAYGWSFVTLVDDMHAKCLISLSPILVQGNHVYIAPLKVDKPSERDILNFIIGLLQNNQNNGLSVLDIQWELFKTFSYRITSKEVKEMVKENPKYLYRIKSYDKQIETIYNTTKYYGDRKYVVARKYCYKHKNIYYKIK